MNPDKQRQIASQGDKAAHDLGVAHEWSHDEAVEAGRKGGINSGEKRRGRSSML